MIAAITSFVMFGTICVYDPSNDFGYSCLNFWERPAVHYPTTPACIEASKKMAKDIRKTLTEDNVQIMSLDIICIPVDKQGKLET